MKINILGLLRMAQRHLHLLDQVKNKEINIAELQDQMEVISAAEILTELMENISTVQADPKQLDEFLKIYCLKKQ